MLIQLAVEVLIILYLVYCVVDLSHQFNGSIGWFAALAVAYILQWTWFLWHAANVKRHSGSGLSSSSTVLVQAEHDVNHSL